MLTYRFAIAVAATVFTMTLMHGQPNYSWLLKRAQSFEEKGDYLFAARIFNALVDEATDSSTISDALYGIASCGEKAASAIALRKSTILGLGTHDSMAIQYRLVRSVEDDIDSISSLRITIHCGGFEGDVC